jgi:hypothetical protein
MVPRTRKIIWSINALHAKKNLFEYWNHRNKSTLYSKKLNLLFYAKLSQVAQYPESSIGVDFENIRMALVSNYYIIFEVTSQYIKVLDIWDTRKNPINFPIK